MAHEPLTDAQQEILTAIKYLAGTYTQENDQVKTTRKQLYHLIKMAEKLKLSTYQIADAAHLSQPRISQIVRSDGNVEEVPTSEDTRSDALSGSSGLESDIK